VHVAAPDGGKRCVDAGGIMTAICRWVGVHDQCCWPTEDECELGCRGRIVGQPRIAGGRAGGSPMATTIAYGSGGEFRRDVYRWTAANDVDGRRPVLGG